MYRTLIANDSERACDGLCERGAQRWHIDRFETIGRNRAELIVPYLQGAVDGYRDMGYYTIKHTDGNIVPILEQMAGCGPDAIHSLDTQGGVSLPEVRKIEGDDIGHDNETIGG